MVKRERKLQMIEPNLSKNWTTHIGVLIKVLLISEGDVIELGTGPYSTPLLHWLCKDMERKLISCENDLEYYRYARQYKSNLHRIILVKDWNQIDTQTHRGVVFVDHNPPPIRTNEIIKFKDSADYIVIHDTEVKEDFVNIWQHFKHIYTWKECRPWVSVVSNFKDLSPLELNMDRSKVSNFLNQLGYKSPLPIINNRPGSNKKNNGMKNLMIYISPTGSFDNDRPDLTCNDADYLVKIQIDNSLELGWKKEDILLVTNFDYQYQGIKALVLKDVPFFERKPQASKINAIVKMFENGLINSNQTYWFHDLDAIQSCSIPDLEIDFEASDMVLTDYGLSSRWSTGVIYFKDSAKDIFGQIRDTMYKKNIDEERALTYLTRNNEEINKRVKKINKSFNFTPRYFKTMYPRVLKPIKVLHFHPYGEVRPGVIQKSFDFFNGENNLGIQLISDRLLKILKHHGIE